MPRKKDKKTEKQKIVDKKSFFIVLAEFQNCGTPRAFGGFATSKHANTIKNHLVSNIDDVVFAQVMPIEIGD